MDVNPPVSVSSASASTKNATVITEMKVEHDGLEPPVSTARSGHVTVQNEKPFTIFSALAIGYSLTNTPAGIMYVLGNLIPMGGSPLIFWGLLLLAPIGLATVTTLAEFISAIPHPGGQYIWVHRLAPPRYRRFLSYATAMISWLSAVATGASACLVLPTGICNVVQFVNPGFVQQKWMIWVGYQLINILTVIPASFEYALPKIAKGMLGYNVVSMLAVIVTLFVMARHHTSARALFLTPINITGWPDGAAFIMGLNSINWCFSCLDSTTHLAEEIPDLAVNIPKVLIFTLISGFSTGLLAILAVLVNVGSFDASADTTGLAIFLKITQSQAAALVLWFFVILSATTSVWSIQTWQSRLAWAISRDGGFPLHRYISRISPEPFYTPTWAMIMSSTFTALFGCLYLGSELAFNSIVSTAIILQFLSYSIPTILLIINGRSSFKHGPFWLPRLGLLANVVMLIWTLIALVFFCFPFYLPVVGDQMNYTAPVLVAIGILIASLWFIHARKNYEVKEIL